MRRALALVAVLLLATAPGAMGQAISDFESLDPTAYGNGTVMFRQPSFSGSTGGQLDTTDPANNVSQLVAGNWMMVRWLWAPTGSWLRLTTYAATVLPNPAIDYTQKLVFSVLYPAGDPLGIALGSRDNGTTAAIGADGTAVGPIEWIGASGGDGTVGPTVTQTISASPEWQTITIDIPNEPVTAFAGTGVNGVLDNTRGTIEHLAFVRTGAAGPYEIYLDNFHMVPEPGSLLALCAGLAGFAGLLRRRA